MSTSDQLRAALPEDFRHGEILAAACRYIEHLEDQRAEARQVYDLLEAAMPEAIVAGTPPVQALRHGGLSRPPLLPLAQRLALCRIAIDPPPPLPLQLWTDDEGRTLVRTRLDATLTKGIGPLDETDREWVRVLCWTDDGQPDRVLRVLYGGEREIACSWASVAERGGS